MESDNSCPATCRNGTKCLNNKKPGREYCWLHDKKMQKQPPTNDGNFVTFK